MPDLAGHYFYADHCRGWIRSFRYQNGRAVDARRWNIAESLSPTSFGTDGAGELHVASLSGEVYRIVPPPASGSTLRR